MSNYPISSAKFVSDRAKFSLYLSTGILIAVLDLHTG